MADNVIRSFLVDIGFAVDTSAAKKVEETVAKTEATITKTTAAESAKRGEVEQKASSGRLTLAQAFGKLLALEEQKLSDARDKTRKAEAEKDDKRQQETEKKTRERRDASLKAMQAGALKLASLAVKAVVAVEASALAVVYATDRAAKSMERLNYQSKMAGASPRSMTAFSYAAGQLGANAETANAELEEFGKKLKTYPGFAESLGRVLGKSVRDANGQLRDTGQLATELGGKLAEIQKNGGRYGRANALAQGSAFSFNDQNVINAMQDPRFASTEGENNRIQNAVGTDLDDAAKSGTAFEVSMRRLEAVIDAIKTKISTGLFKELQPELEKLSAWGETHGSAVADIIGRIAEDILRLANYVIDHLANVDWDSVLTKIETFAKDFERLSTKYFGENGAIIVTLSAFGLLIGSKVLGPLNAVLSTLSLIGRVPLVGRLLGGGARAALGAINPVTVGAAAIIAGATAESTPGAGIPADAAERTKVTDENKRLTDEANRKQGSTGSFLQDSWNYIKGKIGLSGTPNTPDNRVRDAILSTDKGIKELVEVTKHPAASAGGGFDGEVSASSGGTGGSGRHFGGVTSPGASMRDHAGPSRPAKGTLATNQKEAYAAALKEGLSPTAARALVANMSGEGLAVPGDHHWDVTHMASGIVQWDPTRSAAIKAQFGAMPHQLSVTDQTRAAIWEMKTNPAYGLTWRALQGSDPAAMIDSLVRNYENPRDKNGAISTRLGYLKGFNPTVSTSGPSASAPSPAGTSERAITDAVVFAARQRLAAGGHDPKDIALRDRYLKQQNTPAKVEVVKPLPGLHAALAAHARAGTLASVLNPHGHHPFGVSPSMMASIDNSRRRGDNTLHYNPTFVSHGGDPRSMMADARRDAGRGSADMMRNLSTIET